MMFQTLLVAALALAAPAKLSPADAFAICDEAERKTRLIMIAWQVETPRDKAMEFAEGNKALEAVVADLYDYVGPARGRTKEQFLRKWQERCLAHPEAFALPSK